jgi:hypothetical protein
MALPARVVSVAHVALSVERSTVMAVAVGALSCQDALRAAGIPVLMGGPHVTELPDEAIGGRTGRVFQTTR